MYVIAVNVFQIRLPLKVGTIAGDKMSQEHESCRQLKQFKRGNVLLKISKWANLFGPKKFFDHRLNYRILRQSLLRVQIYQ